MIQQTSLLAFQELKPILGEKQRLVLSTLKLLGEANNMMIAKSSGLPINSVTPRVHELRELGLIIEAYKEKCPFTNRITIFWRENGY